MEFCPRAVHPIHLGWLPGNESNRSRHNNYPDMLQIVICEIIKVSKAKEVQGWGDDLALF